MEPVSILTHAARQHARLHAAIDRVWNRDAGRYRDDLRKILRNVESGALTVAAAHELVAQLDADTQRRPPLRLAA